MDITDQIDFGRFINAQAQEAIIVVDDDPIFRLTLRTFLQNLDYRVLEAGSGEESLTLLENEPADLILMDADMPGMGGFEACRRIKSQPARADLPVLIVTALGEDRFVDMAFEAGASDYLQKPLQWAVLRNRIYYLLKARQTEGLQRRLGCLLDASVNEIYICDQKTLKFTYVNQGARDNIGYSMDELRAMTPMDIKPQCSEESLSERLRPFLSGEQEQIVFETEHQRKDGSIYPVEIHIQSMQISGPPQYVAIAIDISDRRQAENRIREQGEFLQVVINGVAEPVMVIDADYTVRLMNEVIRAKMDMALISDPQHPKCYEISHRRNTPCDSAEHPCPLRDVLSSGQPVTVTHNHPLEDGTPRYFELNATPLHDGSGNIIGVVESSHDITEHLQIQEELRDKQLSLEHLAHHDSLTGLPNRILLIDRLDQAIHKASRRQEQLAVLFIDLDEFKHINDSLGHDKGDAVLIAAAARLRNAIREEDTVVRLGGDEFTVIMESMHSPQQATVLAQKLIRAFQAPFRIDEHELILTMSIGISLYPQDGQDVDVLMRNADAAMYRAKDQGRNTFQYYTVDMTEQAFERVLMENRMRRGLENGEYVVYYQPQVNLDSGQLIGVEALVRWQHPDLGLILPGNFISLAEDTGLIVAIGGQVLQTACEQIAAWYKAGLSPGRVAVNVSARQIGKDALLKAVRQALRSSGCQPDWLELEITESFAMSHPDVSIPFLNELKALGVNLSIDDFGTGYSSLAYLKRLPISKLKIDRSFVRDIVTDADDWAIVKSVLALGHSMSLEVLAEGVETTEQEQCLRDVGCDSVQGYLYGQPVTAEAMTDILRHWPAAAG